MLTPMEEGVDPSFAALALAGPSKKVGGKEGGKEGGGKARGLARPRSQQQYHQQQQQQQQQQQHPPLHDQEGREEGKEEGREGGREDEFDRVYRSESGKLKELEEGEEKVSMLWVGALKETVDVQSRLMRNDCYVEHVVGIRELREYVREVRGLYGLREEEGEGGREEGVE